MQILFYIGTIVTAVVSIFSFSSTPQKSQVNPPVQTAAVEKALEHASTTILAPTQGTTSAKEVERKAVSIPKPIKQPIPTQPVSPPEVKSKPASSPTITPSVQPQVGCCKYCSKGKACGNSCISRSYTCHKAPGCACDI